MNDSIDDADLEELTERVRTQSAEAPGSDTERVTIRSLEVINSDSLATLREEFETDPPTETNAEPTFVLSEENADRLLEDSSESDLEALEDRLGRPVTVSGEMPDDTVLLLTPDAVDGAELLEPEGIACGIVVSR
ncbi:hypothetical protein CHINAEXTREME_07105 [Halobiforma lacisalsi AJ5]|uniref:Uncharacterized protein n=1 Tax=Natronobacterium lacisalsi AJ5 TaxID=358396 RepID=M0LU40_NATLA|nr:hypothetical protein [Halobiforma lacisalsi]APW97556.1 hypothetical protein CHINAEXTREME_07105 [Halobiforma lacisalsi AJ5]EMA37062.1 hypothetical protein C445_02441 [Halobiforma lacisalsi AJ5]